MSDQETTLVEEAARAGALADEYDTIVIGAGFAGMYMLYRVRQLGMSTAALEQAPDVGGTWYWNAYPGARCDAESLMYNYAFDPDLREEYQYKWPEKYSRQPVILDYARHVAQRYDLRRDIHFNTRVTKASWDEDARLWVVQTDRGDTTRCRFLLSAVGCLSDSQVPDFPGLDSFAGSGTTRDGGRTARSISPASAWSKSVRGRQGCRRRRCSRSRPST